MLAMDIGKGYASQVKCVLHSGMPYNLTSRDYGTGNGTTSTNLLEYLLPCTNVVHTQQIRHKQKIVHIKYEHPKNTPANDSYQQHAAFTFPPPSLPPSTPSHPSLPPHPLIPPFLHTLSSLPSSTPSPSLHLYQ